MGVSTHDLSEVVTLDAIWSILEGVWESLLGAVPMPVPPSGDLGPEFCAAITLHGAVHAVVTLNCPRRTAQHMARYMLASSDEHLDEDDVLDAVGEVCNVIGGNVKSLFAESVRLGLPQVTTSRPDLSEGRLLQQVDVCWPDHRASVAIWELPDSDQIADPTNGTTETSAAAAAGRETS